MCICIQRDKTEALFCVLRGAHFKITGRSSDAPSASRAAGMCGRRAGGGGTVEGLSRSNRTGGSRNPIRVVSCTRSWAGDYGVYVYRGSESFGRRVRPK